MHPALAIVCAGLLLFGAAVSLRIAIREYRRPPALSQQAEAVWPLAFPVYWLDYYLGPTLARYLRVGQVALYPPLFLLGAFDILFAEGSTTTWMALNLAIFFGSVWRGSTPLQCVLDDRGIQFQEQAIFDRGSQPRKRMIPWETVRRWNLNDRRLQFVASSSTNSSMLFTVAIPLNGLSPALQPWLAEQVEAHIVGSAAVAG